ncbi:MAG: glycosyltransferase family 4 protein [Vicinamibacterales bacterium]
MTSTSAPVLHLAPYLWSGAGGVITRLCEHQARRRPVYLATTGRAGGAGDWAAYRTRLRRAGVHHVTLDSFHRDPESYWASATRLARLYEAIRPPVVHAHAGVPTALAVTARDLSRGTPRVVGQMYSWGPNRPSWMDRQDLWAFARADVVVCSAHAYRRLLVAGAVPAARLAYVPWGLPLDALPFRVAAERRPGDIGPVIGCVGRLEPRKAQAELVDAFAVVRRRHPQARLELVGPIADRVYGVEVRRAIRAHGLGGAVRLCGLVPDVPAMLRTWDLFVSLSTDEGQGLAVLEAMATGVPVVARVVPGVEDFLVGGRTGWAVSGRSADATARAIRRALDRPAEGRAIARRARRLVERRYDWAAMLGTFERLYRG